MLGVAGLSQPWSAAGTGPGSGVTEGPGHADLGVSDALKVADGRATRAVYSPC